ncbi:GatB/YqeY domain-containing protein [Anaerophilus nitritogenes]|uniref:GatB/YqeY domain-containing protein n=1 Tax=Anaerophilus nitritogenes TaxID=2498136 RepID=UPI00101C06F2|nr:GatB/YqeY domain-containing protein [Anaerophilus nitritogenes]
MLLKERLMADLKEAMKEKNKMKKSVVTLLRSAIKQYEIDHKVELDDESILDIISKQVKQKKDAIDEFTKGDRQDLVDEAKAEIDILMGYLPEQLTKEELSQIVSQVIDEVGANSMKDMGKIMSAIMPKVKGRADGKTINQIIKQFLQ